MSAVSGSSGTEVVADLRRPTRWLAAILIPIGPAAVALLRFVLPYDTVDDATTIVAKVAADPDAQSLTLWLGLVAILTLVPGALWVGRLTRRRSPRLTAAGLLLLVPGYLSLVPGYLSLAWVMSADVLLLSGTTVAVDQATLAQLYEASHTTSEIAEMVFVAAHVMGTILLGIAMWLSRAVPRWAALLTIVSQPLHIVAAVIVVSHPLDLAAWGMQAVGFGAAAVAIVRLRDADWDLAPAPPH